MVNTRCQRSSGIRRTQEEEEEFGEVRLCGNKILDNRANRKDLNMR